MKTGKGLPAITLLGQASSGKTNLLAAFLNHNASWTDLERGFDAVENISLKENFESGGDQERAFDYLRGHFVSMLEGKENLLEGTNAARRYDLSLSYFEQLQEEPVKSGWLQSMSMFNGASVQKSHTHDFQIVDGRGADAAPREMIKSEDKDSVSRRQKYRDGMDDSVGFVLFMPLMSDDEGSEASISQRFLSELNLALQRKEDNPKLPRLRNISLCFTKCERAFMRDGIDGLDNACDPESYENLLHGNAVLSTFRSALSKSLYEQSYEMRVFPVSTYGFIRNTGAANFYPWPAAPGILTRSVDPFDDYDNPEMPDFKDHFPFPLKDDQAKSLWRPFNIAPPLLYALTGRITGPLSFSAEEALEFIAD